MKNEENLYYVLGTMCVMTYLLCRYYTGIMPTLTAAEALSKLYRSILRLLQKTQVSASDRSAHLVVLFD